MTLVEVVAGLALLGSLLVSLLLAKVGLARQRVEAENRLAAVAAADALLAEWAASDQPVPRHALGHTGTGNRFSWTTRIVRLKQVADLSMEVIRLELSQDIGGGPKVLASVELLRPPQSAEDVIR